jgi:hypothetical protein
LPEPKMFSVGQVIRDSVYEDDFQKRFGATNGTVAVYLDSRFTGSKSKVVHLGASKPAEVWELLDGMIVYESNDSEFNVIQIESVVRAKRLAIPPLLILIVQTLFPVRRGRLTLETL